METEHVLEHEEENKDTTNNVVNEQALPKMIVTCNNRSSSDNSSIPLPLLCMSILGDSSNEDTSNKETCYTCKLPLLLSRQTSASLCHSKGSNVKPNQVCYAKDKEISATSRIMSNLKLRDESTVIGPENVAEIGAVDN